MATTPTQIPDPIRAGTTVVYRRSFPDYPATDGWALTLYIAGKSVLEKDAAVVDGVFEITLATTDTDDLVPGVHTWVEQASKAGVVEDAASGSVTVLANISTAGAGDLQSPQEKELELVNAAIEQLLNTGKTIVAYSIGGRAVRREDLKTLYEIRAKLEAQIARQKSGRFTQPVRIRFPGMGAES